MFDWGDAIETGFEILGLIREPWVLALILLLFVGIVGVILVAYNDCSGMECQVGVPRMIDDQCLCVGPADGDW